MTAQTPVDIGTFVTRTPGVYGGRPCLAGTRFPILSVAAEYNGGSTAEEIGAHFGLPIELVFAGLAYYFANRTEIDAELEEEARTYHEAAGAALRAKGPGRVA